MGLIEREKLERMHGAVRELSPPAAAVPAYESGWIALPGNRRSLGVSISTVVGISPALPWCASERQSMSDRHLEDEALLQLLDGESPEPAASACRLHIEAC